MNYKILSTRNINILIFALLTTCFFCFFYLYPPALDDFWFLTHIKDSASEAGHPENLWTGLFGTFMIHYNLDNARLANTVYPFMLIIPRIIPAIISTIAFALTYWMVLKLSESKSVISVLWAGILICLCLPWHDNLFVIMYSMNYVWTAPLFLFAISAFLKDSSTNYWGCFFLGLLVSISHEGFGVPLLFATSCLLLSKRTTTTKSRIFLIIGLIVGLIYFFSAPSFLARFRYNFANRLEADFFSTFYVLKADWLYFCFLITWIAAASIKRYRSIAFSHHTLILLLSGLANLPIHCFANSLRTTFVGVLVSIIGLIYLINQFNKSKILCIVKYLFTCGAAILISAHLFFSLQDMSRLHNEVIYAINKFQQIKPTSQSDTVFASITPDHKIPWIMLCKTNFIQSNTSNNLSNFLGIHKRQILPPVFKNYHGQYDKKLLGNAGGQIYNGFIIIPWNDNIKIFDSVTQNVFVGLNEKYRQAFIFQFTGADNKKYALLLPITLISDIDRTPTGVNIVN